MNLDKISNSSDSFENIKSYILREGETDISLSGRYICVYTCDKLGNYSYLYDVSDTFSAYFKENMKKNEIHKNAATVAFTGKKVSYDWFDNENFPTFFNTLIIPLSNKNGKVSSLLFVVKALDDLLVRKNNKMIVAEKAGQSFVQVIMRAREEEKRLVSSAIHDQLGNFSIRTNALLELLEADILTKTPKETIKTLRDLQKTLRETVHSMKEIIASLRPPQLETVGLNASIKELLEKISKTTDLKIKYSYKIKEKTVLSPNTKLILYRAVQEALSNTVKYAQAQNFTVELKEDSTSLYLTIKDDGKGFTPQVHKSVKSLGLAGMKENIVSLKGTIKLISKLGSGTTIKIKCPKFQYIR
ncbi:MAG: sensor histidine kinase [Elusimicrobiaceae bacterium]|nr:sensor histidine kinase [Elusimicrobiaceae bacterium]